MGSESDGHDPGCRMRVPLGCGGTHGAQLLREGQDTRSGHKREDLEDRGRFFVLFHSAAGKTEDRPLSSKPGRGDRRMPVKKIMALILLCLAAVLLAGCREKTAPVKPAYDTGITPETLQSAAPVTEAESADANA